MSNRAVEQARGSLDSLDCQRTHLGNVGQTPRKATMDE
jgi:hypothetical protein